MRKSAKGANKRQHSSSHADSERNILEEQATAFEKRFGKRPGPNDPVFFDPDAGEPSPLSAKKVDKYIIAAMQTAGTPPEIVYAYKKTGMLLLDKRKPTYPAAAVVEWDAAVDEYFAMEVDGKHSDAPPINHEGPMVPATEIPELRAIPPDAEDQRFIFACLGALDEHLEKHATSLRVKVELAAAVLVMGASSAFDAASDLGHPKEAQASYDTFVNLVVVRARELFERNRQ